MNWAIRPNRGRPWASLAALVLLLAVSFAGAPPASGQEAASPEAGAAATPADDIAALLPAPGPLPAGEARSGGPLSVVATTGILADLVRQVGGQRVEVQSILPPNADPHDFEPEPQNLVEVEDADLVVRHGLHLDDWSDELIENANTTAPVVVATEGVQTLSSDEETFSEGDPHVWFDPTRVATMVDNIVGGLVAVDPDGEPAYRERSAAYKDQLTALDAGIKAAIDTIPPERRKLVTNHDALHYYADRYGLRLVGTVIPGLGTTAEPSAQDVAALLEVIKREQVPAIFAENTTSPKLAEQLASEAGVKVVDDLYSDNTGDPGSGADTYIGLMRTDTIAIVEALR